jgi:hypothetical protein
MSASYRDLKVWQRSMKLALRIYATTVAVSEAGIVWTSESNAQGCGIDPKQHR